MTRLAIYNRKQPPELLMLYELEAITSLSSLLLNLLFLPHLSSSLSLDLEVQEKLNNGNDGNIASPLAAMTTILLEVKH